MKRIKLKQGTLAWEAARESRIGSSEVFDIIRYYATDTELQNCGFNAEAVRAEKPYTTAWALYHKILNDGLYHKGQLPPELSEYGHAVEPYGAAILQQGREIKLKRGEVYINDRLIASLDISGITEEVDERDFDYGTGKVQRGKKFVCEQKSINSNFIKNGVPIKHIFQAQYQITMTKADLFILQIMVLENDTVFERGKITQASAQSMKQLRKYLDGKITVSHIYFANNEQLAMLIKTCLKRFFNDVDSRNEPKAYLVNDSQRNIIESLRANSFYNKNKEVECDIQEYVKAKAAADEAEKKRLETLQDILDIARANNASKFISSDGYRGSFSASGSFLTKAPKEVESEAN